MRLPLGKREATLDHQDLRFANYADLDAILPQIPKRFGNGYLFPDWAMLGNGPDDSVAPGFGGAGDCTIAGGDHEEMIFSKIFLGEPYSFSGATAIADYSAVSGYDPATGANDDGAYVRDVLKYRQKTGLVDTKGVRHKIGPYVALDPKSWDHLLAGIFVFGAVGFGFEFPDSAWDQFAKGQRWDYVPGAKNDGGHYTPGVGTVASDSEATCVTWARRQTFSRDFYENQNDEAWAYLPGTLRADGTGFHHFDVTTLLHDLAALKG